MCYDFVHAGPLSLELAFSAADSKFRIHDRWLSIEGATKELCLRGAPTEAKILHHSVKSIFSDALDQLPLEEFGRTYDKSQANMIPDRRKKVEKILAEQRLLNYLQVDNSTVEMVNGRPELRVKWPPHPLWDDVNEIQIQCHRASTCHYLRENVHTVNDLSPNLLHCCTAVENDNKGRNKRRCRFTQLNSSAGEHLENDLEENEEYFFSLVITPSDPGSFVSFSSSNYRCSTRRSL
jgi:hypothetical protein